MAKHQIFLVHGMGDFEPGWSAGIEQQLRDLFQKYPTARLFADRFGYKEINYNRVFEKWRQQWKSDASALLSTLQDAKLDAAVAQRLLTLAGSAGGASFWQTHVLDVVLYRFLRAVAEEVWREVQTQILAHLTSFQDRPNYSIVCHSLGTAVAYETLHAMITDSPPLPFGARPVNFIAVSNTARLLWNRGGDPYPVAMGPSFSDDRGMCLSFFNLRHALDPVCNVTPFHAPPDRWFPEPAMRDEVYIDVELAAADIRQANIHAMEHYLSHPDVHAPVLRRLTKTRLAVSAAEQQAAVAEWRATALKGAARSKATQALGALAVQASSNWLAELDMLYALRDRIAAGADGEN